VDGGLLWVGDGETSCVGEGLGASLGLTADRAFGEEVVPQAATIRINARTLPLIGRWNGGVQRRLRLQIGTAKSAAFTDG